MLTAVLVLLLVVSGGGALLSLEYLSRGIDARRQRS